MLATRESNTYVQLRTLTIGNENLERLLVGTVLFLVSLCKNAENSWDYLFPWHRARYWLWNDRPLVAAHLA